MGVRIGTRVSRNVWISGGFFFVCLYGFCVILGAMFRGVGFLALRAIEHHHARAATRQYRTRTTTRRVVIAVLVTLGAGYLVLVIVAVILGALNGKNG